MVTRTLIGSAEIKAHSWEPQRRSRPVASDASLVVAPAQLACPDGHACEWLGHALLGVDTG